jgi:hypothetical protein
VKSLVHTLRLVALLGLLLPGLLVPQGETLRVCLHDWFGFADACGDVAPETSCCAQAPAELALSEGHECQGCCFEITNDACETPVPSGFGHSASAILLAPERRPSVMAWPALRARVPYRSALIVAPPGRAPSPLRI